MLLCLSKYLWPENQRVADDANEVNAAKTGSFDGGSESLGRDRDGGRERMGREMESTSIISLLFRFKCK
jgi:hypothetical protein